MAAAQTEGEGGEARPVRFGLMVWTAPVSGVGAP